MTFGERLTRAIKSRGFTQKEAGYLCDLSQPGLARYCALAQPPKRSTIDWFSRALGIPVEELLGESAASRRGLRSVRERLAAHGISHPDPHWMVELKRHWHSTGAPRQHIETTIRFLFRNQAPHILAWLQKDP